MPPKFVVSETCSTRHRVKCFLLTSPFIEPAKDYFAPSSLTIATLALALASGLDAMAAVELANLSAGIVVAKQNNALQIFALDDAAARLGLEIGLPLANARAICPQVKVYDADEAADAAALNAIAGWCDRFTPLVALDPPHGLLLDITGCVHLFGGEAAMMRRLCDVLTAQGFAVSAAIAELGEVAIDLPSGAGHDAMCVAAVAPVAMIFVPSAGGRSL